MFGFGNFFGLFRRGSGIDVSFGDPDEAIGPQLDKVFSNLGWSGFTPEHIRDFALGQFEWKDASRMPVIELDDHESALYWNNVAHLTLFEFGCEFRQPGLHCFLRNKSQIAAFLRSLRFGIFPGDLREIVSLLYGRESLFGFLALACGLLRASIFSNDGDFSEADAGGTIEVFLMRIVVFSNFVVRRQRHAAINFGLDYTGCQVLRPNVLFDLVNGKPLREDRLFQIIPCREVS